MSVEFKKYLFILFAFLTGTLWIYLKNLGNYPVETCVARYLIAFFVFFFFNILISNRDVILSMKKKIKMQIIMAGSLILISAFVTGVLYQFGIFHSHLIRQFVFVFVINAVLYMLGLYFFNKLSESFFLAGVVFLVGTMYSFAFPMGSGISWDDQIHYESSLQISHLSDNNFLEADSLLINVVYSEDDNIIEKIFSGSTGDYENKVNELYDEGSKYEHTPASIGMNMVAYLPEAIVLFFARGMGIKYTYVFALGRWAGVILFSVFLYFSLKKIKSGRLVFFMISMFPTTLFLMANYSYDPWGIALPMYAFADYIGILQDANRKMELKDIIRICLIFALGFAAKPIYFFMILSVLFIDKNKLSCNLSKKKYQFIVIFTFVVVALSFIAPYLMTGAGGNDMRGGDGVDSGMQVAFILSHPLKYAIILMNFLKYYWGLANATVSVSSFAYLGVGGFSLQFIVFCIVVVFLDKKHGDAEITTFKRRVWTFIIAFISSCWVATALYVAYTPVGSETISGVQWRYLIPLFPFVGYYISDYRMVAVLRKYISQKLLVSVASVASVIYASYCIYDLMLRYY